MVQVSGPSHCSSYGCLTHHLLSVPLYLPNFMHSVDALLGISHPAGWVYAAMGIRLLPFETEAVSGELRVQITFEANKVGR